MPQKKYKLLILLISVSLLGLAYWFSSTFFVATETLQQIPVEEGAYQVDLPPTNIKTAPAASSDSHTSKADTPIPKGLIVLLKPDALIDPNKALAKYLNMPEISHDKLQHLNIITLVIPEAWDLEPIQKEIAQDPAVLSVSKNARTHGYQVTPNDPLFTHPSEWGLNAISAPQAWNYTTGDETVVIAVMDTGVDYTHPDMRDNAWVNEAELRGLPNVDDDHPEGPRPCHPRDPFDLFCDDIYGTSTSRDNENNDPQDVGVGTSHGTAVAGIIAASGNNAAFSTGVAWRAKILPIVVFNDGISGSLFQYLEAVEYLLEMKLRRGVNIRAINLSGSLLNPSIRRYLLQLLEDANILFVHAAGNSRSLLSSRTVTPSPIVIEVASIDSSRELSTFSNFGPLAHVAAPGSFVPTLLSRLAYSNRQFPPLFFSARSGPYTHKFDQWLIQPPASWAITNVDTIRYQSTQAETTLQLSLNY